MAVDEGTIFLSIFIFNLAGIVFVTPLIKQKSINTELNAFTINTLPIYITFILAIIFLIASHGIHAFNAVFSIEALQARIGERGYERVGSGFYALIRQANSFLLIVFALQFVKQGKEKSVVYIVLVCLYSWLALMISGSKYEALFLVVVIIVLYYYWKRALGMEVLNYRKLIVGTIGFLVFVGFAGYIRGFGSWQVEGTHPFFTQIIYQTTNAFDAPDNLIVLLDRTESWVTGELGPILARDYLILPFIPRAIWETKPLIQGNQLVMQSYFPERFSGYTGETISPSFPGEMILTGGIFYMIIWLFILGILFSWIYRRAQTRGGLYLVAYIWCILNIFNFLRSGTGVVGYFIVFMTVAIALQTIIDVIYFAINGIKMHRGMQ